MIFIIYELLKDYYGFTKFTLKNEKDYVIIFVKEKVFFLYRFESFPNVEKCYFLSSKIPYCDSFVYNNQGNYVTTIENHFYVLIYRVPGKNYLFSPFSFYQVDEKISLNWRSLWIQRSDYMNSFYSSIQGKYPFIDESISYYMGLLEMSIYLLNDFDNYYDIGYIQHQVFDEEQYFNPFNLIVDVKERDFVEYLKYLFLQNLYKNVDISDIIQKGKGIFQYDLVIARLILPNYYFSLVDDIILKKSDESTLKEIINRAEEYGIYVKKIVQEISKCYVIKKYPFL